MHTLYYKQNFPFVLNLDYREAVFIQSLVVCGKIMWQSLLSSRSVQRFPGKKALLSLYKSEPGSEGDHLAWCCISHQKRSATLSQCSGLYHKLCCFAVYCSSHCDDLLLQTIVLYFGIWWTHFIVETYVGNLCSGLVFEIVRAIFSVQGLWECCSSYPVFILWLPCDKWFSAWLSFYVQSNKKSRKLHFKELNVVLFLRNYCIIVSFFFFYMHQCSLFSLFLGNNEF